MQTVTDIKRARQSSDCFRVYVDEEFMFELSSLDLSVSGLRIGQAITAEEVAEYQNGSEAKQVYNLAIRFLSIRARSTREMSDYLLRKGCDSKLVQSSLERLEAAKLLDDAEFASNWIANRQLLRPRSKRHLEQELMAKGIARDIISQAVADIGVDQELDLLVEVADRKRKLPQYRDSQKLIAYLMRQGYSYDLIKKAIERLE